jgi:hypothetical protein
MSWSLLLRHTWPVHDIATMCSAYAEAWTGHLIRSSFTSIMYWLYKLNVIRVLEAVKGAAAMMGGGLRVRQRPSSCFCYPRFGHTVDPCNSRAAFCIGSCSINWDKAAPALTSMHQNWCRSRPKQVELLLGGASQARTKACCWVCTAPCGACRLSFAGASSDRKCS